MAEVKERQGYIYKLTTPDNKVYIGKTKSLARRWNKYKNCTEHGLMYKEISKWGWDNIEKEFLFSGIYNEELFSELEKHYIQLYNTFDSPLGLNSQSGGKKGFRTSKKSLKNISIAHLGHKPSKETKIKMSLSQSKRRGTEPLFGKKKKVSFSYSDSVYFDFQTGIYYPTITSASESLGIKRTTLNAMISGQNKNTSNLKKV